MFALILTLCIANGHCYESAPMRFDSLGDCFTEMQHLRTSGQIGANRLACRRI